MPRVACTLLLGWIKMIWLSSGIDLEFLDGIDDEKIDRCWIFYMQIICYKEERKAEREGFSQQTKKIKILVQNRMNEITTDQSL